MDLRRDLARTVDVLAETNADIVGLQEVLRTQKCDQADLVARALDMELAWGKARTVRDGSFGNALFVRGDVLETRVHDLAVPHCEPRICLESLVSVRGTRVRVFVCHFGLGFRERERQAARLREVLFAAKMDAPRVVLGDFNEWQRRGPVHRALTSVFPSAPKPLRTHPSVLPIFALDRIAWDEPLRGDVSVRFVRHASDHRMLEATLDA